MEENYESMDGAAETAIMAGLGTFLLIGFALLLLVWIGRWKVFVKAGRPGWASIIPIYNTIVMLDIVGKPTWWVAIILLVPIANIVFAIMLINQLALCFGKGTGTTLLLLFFPYIGYPMLGFGDAQYTRPVGATAAAV